MLYGKPQSPRFLDFISTFDVKYRLYLIHILFLAIFRFIYHANKYQNKFKEGNLFFVYGFAGTIFMI